MPLRTGEQVAVTEENHLLFQIPDLLGLRVLGWSKINVGKLRAKLQEVKEQVQLFTNCFCFLFFQIVPCF